MTDYVATLDFSIAENLPPAIQQQLQELITDYQDESLTAKGYHKKRQQLLEKYATTTQNSLLNSPRSSLDSRISNERKRVYRTGIGRSGVTDNQSIMSSVTPIKKDTPSLYRVTTVHSNAVASTPASSRVLQVGKRNTNASSDSLYDPMIPLLPRFQGLSKNDWDSLPLVLRKRSELYERETAMVRINAKGKESTISWGKLFLRAEKVAHELSAGKYKLYKMDKVVLWYDQDESIEFTVSLLGCFIAGMIAVPVSLDIYSLTEIHEIIKMTNSKFILISDQCHNKIDGLYANPNTKLKLTKTDLFAKLTFLRTDDLGTYSKAKKATPTYDIPSVSYVEFTRTPLGRLSGVIMKHQILAGQFENMARIIDSRESSTRKKIKIIRKYKDHRTPQRHTILNTLNPTRSTGLIFGILFNIFSGNLLINVDKEHLKTPGSYESLISKYRASILLNDQLQLKQVVINYLENPEHVISRKAKIDFTPVKHCLTSCTTIDTEVTDMVVHKWLKNLGCLDASQCYTPILTLLDFGGIFISTKDQLGNLENFPLHDVKLKLQDELYLNKEKLKENLIRPSIQAMMNSSSSKKDFLRLSSFGFPLPDSTICVVNPDDLTLSPDLTVGEIWVNSPSITDEFFQMEKINDFVFGSRLNFSKMAKQSIDEYVQDLDVSEKLNMIMGMGLAEMNFTRTKLIGFVHNGKMYVLSLIEDTFVQNQLVRLPNWSHTSDVTRADTKSNHSKESSGSERSTDVNHKRVLQSFYLQHITENIVRTVDTVSEVSAFELPHNREEHFLVVVVESILANSNYLNSGTSTVSRESYLQIEKRMNLLTEQIYKMLWIFHKIQPFCVLVVKPGSMPRRYCSLEIANSTVEKKFLDGLLKSKFVKFQLDNVILDFIPHSFFHNESIFSEHLSRLRHKSIKDTIHLNNQLPADPTWQTSGIDYRQDSLDLRSGKKLTSFESIIDILHFRIANYSNDLAFCNEGAILTQSLDKYSWKSFDAILAAFVKKIVESKTPLKKGDHVIVMCENSVEYSAIVLSCFLCNLVVIPLPIMIDSHSSEEIKFLIKIIKAYKVKRIFIDSKVNLSLESNTNIGQLLKGYKSSLPKITVVSKIKRKSNLSLRQFSATVKSQFGTSARNETDICLIWINKEFDCNENLHSLMTHRLLLNQCKVLKETLQLSHSSRIYSIADYTHGFGFLQSCCLGVYTGSTTSLFSAENVFRNPAAFLIGLQNLGVKDLYLSPELLYLVLDKSKSILQSQSRHSTNNRNEVIIKKGSTLSPGFLRNVPNIMLPFSGRPNYKAINILLSKYPEIGASLGQINYIYSHRFNPFISIRSYLGIPPVDIFLDPTCLREGIIKEVDPSQVSRSEYDKLIHLQDSGIVPVCTEVSIVNPETLEPCYENEIGEIWCCSEATVLGHYVVIDSSHDHVSKASKSFDKEYELRTESFISKQFNAKIVGNVDKGLTYLRTGDLGFIKTVTRVDNRGNNMTLSLLFVLGSINETIEVLGLTHFVLDLEATVKGSHPNISHCIILKTGGLLACLIECYDSGKYECSNITPLIVSSLLNKHGILLDLCTFVKPGSTRYMNKDWPKNRRSLLEDWLNGKLSINSQFSVGLGENSSIYLLSDFEKKDESI